MNHVADEQILRDLCADEQRKVDDAMKQLYQQHYPVIANFISNNSGSESDAADVFQDAIIVFYQKIRRGQLELKCSIQTYIYSVCKNMWLSRLRMQKREVSLTDDMESIPIEPEHLALLSRDNRKEKIAALMGQLGEGCRDVLIFYYFERLRMREIARRMGFANEQVAKNKKSGCMKKLKQLVKDSPILKKLLQ